MQRKGLILCLGWSNSKLQSGPSNLLPRVQKADQLATQYEARRTSAHAHSGRACQAKCQPPSFTSAKPRRNAGTMYARERVSGHLSLETCLPRGHAVAPEARTDHELQTNTRKRFGPILGLFSAIVDSPAAPLDTGVTAWFNSGSKSGWLRAWIRDPGLCLTVTRSVLACIAICVLCVSFLRAVVLCVHCHGRLPTCL